MSDELERIRREHYPSLVYGLGACDAARLLEMLDAAKAHILLLEASVVESNLSINAELTRQRDKGLRAIERVRAIWPHIEVPMPGSIVERKRRTFDPGAPTCLRCKIEEVLK